MNWTQTDHKRIGLALAALLTVCGCAKSERDLPTDPLSDPFIVPVSTAAFEPADGSVTMSWQHIGSTVTRFRITRNQSRPALENVMDWIDVASGVREPGADAQPVQSFTDTTGRSGETYDYAVETSEGLLRYGPLPVGGVILPGARVQDVDLRSSDASAEIEWTLNGSLPVSAVEILRTVDNGPAQVRIEEGALAVSFRDTGLQAGLRYSYVLRTHFTNGLTLQSTAIDRGFFLPGERVSFVTSLPENIRLASHPILRNASLPGTGTFLRLYVTPTGFIVMQRFSNTGGAHGFAGILRDINNTLPESLSFAIQPFGTAHAMLSSIEDGKLILEAFNIPNAQRLDPFGMPAAQPVPFEFTDWPVATGVTRTALTIDDTGLVYVSAGTTLRVLSSELEVLGELDLGTPSPVTSLAVDAGGFLWAAAPGSGQVLRTPSVVDEGTLRAPVWETIETSDGARPTALLSTADDVVLMLDEANREIVAYNLDGDRAMAWGGFDSLDLEAGPNGLMSASGRVYVWDSRGDAEEYGDEAEDF